MNLCYARSCTYHKYRLAFAYILKSSQFLIQFLNSFGVDFHIKQNFGYGVLHDFHTIVADPICICCVPRRSIARSDLKEKTLAMYLQAIKSRFNDQNWFQNSRCYIVYFLFVFIIKNRLSCVCVRRKISIISKIII